ncbi:PAS domain S-box protein [Alkalibacter mobilis]|uniref:PAS domain S-box protein n=1 Tax=Alkalibacter mobilis TaxID=2787712 RepID=UPI00189D2040|nr:PAS domain S-box protein [Alkalibacter mobilis]MBF7097016.1 PAS domain S-box protein [Alkalibacter mobilis]
MIDRDESLDRPIKNLADVIFLVSKDGRIIDCNKKATEVYGYTKEELKNMTVYQIRNRTTREKTRDQLAKAFTEGIRFQTFHFKKDGTKFPVEVRSENSGKGYVISKVRDISKNDKYTENASLFFSMIEKFDEAVLALSADYDIVYWNRGAEEKFGYKSEEIVGKNVRVLIPEDEIMKFENKLDYIKKGHFIEGFETVRLHKEGHEIEVSVYVAPLFDYDGIFSGAIGVYKDVSQRNRLVRDLKQYEQKWRYALQGGKLGVWEWDVKKDRIIYSTPSLDKESELDIESKMSIKDFFSKIHPDYIETVKNNLEESVKTGNDFSAEYKSKDRNGKYIWIEARGIVTKTTKNNEAAKMVGIYENITERKTLGEKLKASLDEMEKLKENAVRANEAKSQFLANMTHELRTPLNGLIATIQILKMTGMNNDQKRYVDMIEKSSKNLYEIINDILDLSKIEAGVMNLNLKPFKLKIILDELFNNLYIAGSGKGLEVSSYVDPKINFEILGDELKLKQILNNLIGNAVKFTSEGFVSFRTTLFEKKSETATIRFEVRDTGEGISEEFKSRIFENFSQSNGDLNKEHKGTGLGLAISKKLANLMGGTLDYVSEQGKGSTFSFTCEFELAESLKKPMEESKEANNKTLISPYDRKTILSVEDNLINQEIMEDLITRKGYDYIPAYTGREALEIIDAENIDLVLMDVQLPGISGIETVKEIRSKTGNKGTLPVIAITAYASHENEEECFEAGFNGYVVKPFDVDVLFDLIHNTLYK